ncbi:hypothetical protein D9611_013859 [Ephemerocybe angulata]|uniref:Uncharacterized protein n=1 Tax=Ephemerocybe angulata TaxID=980116 RepID=A0A8H5BTK4_9AGAR|nr:hypothetical protein D9611_013859 [Tulosesus angulatus]
MNASPRNSEMQARKAPRSPTRKATVKPSTYQAPPISALNVAQTSNKMDVDSEVNIDPGESWYQARPQTTISRRHAKLTAGSGAERKHRPLQAGEYKSTAPIRHEGEEKREERPIIQKRGLTK